MYQVILYKGSENRIGVEGTFTDCINWMAITPIAERWREWELKAVTKSKEIDVSHITRFGSVQRLDNLDVG